MFEKLYYIYYEKILNLVHLIKENILKNLNNINYIIIKKILNYNFYLNNNQTCDIKFFKFIYYGMTY